MRVSMLVRSTLMGMAAVVAAACADSTTAPRVAPGTAVMARGGSQPTSHDTSVATVWIDPRFPVAGVLGDNYLYIPANTICDPATSGYGTAVFDSPCEVASRPFQVTVRWYTQRSHTRMDFTPDIRFQPSVDPLRWARLTIRDNQGFDLTKYQNILWLDPVTSKWVDEAASDPTMLPTADPSGHKMTRRIKHLSGYVIGVNFADDGSGSLAY